MKLYFNWSTLWPELKALLAAHKSTTFWQWATLYFISLAMLKAKNTSNKSQLDSNKSSRDKAFHDCLTKLKLYSSYTGRLEFQNWRLIGLVKAHFNIIRTILWFQVDYYINGEFNVWMTFSSIRPHREDQNPRFNNSFIREASTFTNPIRNKNSWEKNRSWVK